MFFHTLQFTNQNNIVGKPLKIMNNSEFYNACRAGNLSDVKRLLASGANVNTQIGDTVLVAAAEHGHYDVVCCLLDNGASITGAGVYK